MFLAALAPASASAFQKAIWGPPTRGSAKEFPLYHKMGVTLYETNIDWATVAPTKPGDATNPKSAAYHWPAYLTEEVNDAKRYKMNVMIQVKGSPAWANGGHKDGKGVTGEEWAPGNPEAYAAFVLAVAKKYPSVHLWMVWGEPTRAGDFMPWVAPQSYGEPQIAHAAMLDADHRYAQMLNDSYGVLKQFSAKNQIIGGNTWTLGEIDPQQWMANLKLPDGKRPRLSMWGHNPFSYSNPTFESLKTLESRPLFDGEVQYEDLPLIEHWTEKYFGHSIKLFLSEYNIETELDDTFDYPPVNEGTAAGWLKLALQESKKVGWVYALGWINVYDSKPTKSCDRFSCSVARTTGTGLFYASGAAKPDEASWLRYG